MPFTFAHPAIILPLAFLPRRCFSLTGLVVGSMTPDFEYFLRMKVLSNYSHTDIGVIFFDLPLGLLLAFIFHNIVRNSLFDNLPSALKIRFAGFKQFDWNAYFRENWHVVITSLFIGVCSHLFWDGFTHADGHFVQTIPALNEMIEFQGREIPVFKILQHASTLIGGILVVFALFKFPQGVNPGDRSNGKYWTVLISLSLLIVVSRILGGLDTRLYGDLIVTCISAGLISLIFTPWLVLLLRQLDDKKL